MAPLISCPNCAKKLKVADDLGGRKIRCPACGTIFAASDQIKDPKAGPLRQPTDADGETAFTAPGRRRVPRDEEWDRRSSSRQPAKTSRTGLVILLAVGGGVALLGIVAAAAFFWPGFLMQQPLAPLIAGNNARPGPVSVDELLCLAPTNSDFVGSVDLTTARNVVDVKRHLSQQIADLGLPPQAVELLGDADRLFVAGNTGALLGDQPTLIAALVTSKPLDRDRVTKVLKASLPVQGNQTYFRVERSADAEGDLFLAMPHAHVLVIGKANEAYFAGVLSNWGKRAILPADFLVRAKEAEKSAAWLATSAGVPMRILNEFISPNNDQFFKLAGALQGISSIGVVCDVSPTRDIDLAVSVHCFDPQALAWMQANIDGFGKQTLKSARRYLLPLKEGNPLQRALDDADRTFKSELQAGFVRAVVHIDANNGQELKKLDQLVNWDVPPAELPPDIPGVAVDAKGCRLFRFEPRGNHMRSLVFGAGDKSLLAVAANGSFCNLDTTTFEPQKSGRLPLGWPLVAFDLSADGKIGAGVSERGEILLFDMASRQRTVLGKQKIFAAPTLSVSPDGKLLATNPGQKSVKVWDTAQRKVKYTLKGMEAGVVSLLFSPDGKTLATGMTAARVRLWDMANGEAIGDMQGKSRPDANPMPVNSLAFSPDGKALLSGGFAGETRIWDVATRNQRLILSGQFGHVNRAAFSHDGKLMALSNFEGIALFDVNQGQLLASLRTERGFGSRRDLAFSPDDDLLAAIADDCVQLWDMKKIRDHYPQIAKLSAPPEKSANPREGRYIKLGGGDVRSVVFTPDSKRLFASSGVVSQLEIATGRVLSTSEGYAGCLSADCRFLAYQNHGQLLEVRDFENNMTHTSSIGFSLRTGGELAISPDGAHAVVLGPGGAKMYRLPTFAVEEQWTDLGQSPAHVVFAPDGKTFAVAVDTSNDIGHKGLNIFDVATRKEVKLERIGCPANCCIAFSPDGKRIYAGGRRESFQIVNAETGRLVQTLQHDQFTITGIAVHPAGDLIATIGTRGTVTLWSMKTSGKLMQLQLIPNGKQPAQLHERSSAAFSPDGKLLAVGGHELVGIWDVEALFSKSGEPTKVVKDDPKSGVKPGFKADPAPPQPPVAVKVDPNAPDPGPPLAMDANGCTWLRAENTARGKSVGFLPDEKTLITVSMEGSVVAWDVAPARLRKRSQIAQRFLTFATSADGKFGAGALVDPANKVRRYGVFDLATGAAIKEFDKEPGGNVVRRSLLHCDVAFSPDSRHLAIADEDATVKIVFMEGVNVKHTLRCESSMNSLCFSPGGKYLAGGTRGETVIVWDVAGGTELFRLKGDGSPGGGEIVALAFSPDGKSLAAGKAIPGMALVWDLETRKLRHSIYSAGGLHQLAFSPDGKILALSHQSISLHDVEKGTMLASLDPVEQKKKSRGDVAALAFSPQGNFLAGITSDGAQLWDLAKVKEKFPQLTRAAAPLKKGANPRDGWSVTGHDGDLKYVCFTPDGRTALSYGADAKLKRWDVAGGRLLATVTPSSDNGRPIRPTLDGKFVILVSSLAKQKMQLKNLETGEVMPGVINYESESPHGVAVSPDGQFVLIGGRKSRFTRNMPKLQMFRLPSLQLETDWTFDHDIDHVVYSPDSKKFALVLKASAKSVMPLERALRIFDVATRREIASCPLDDPAENRLLTFSPDGKLVFVGGAKGMVSIWDSQTGAALGNLATEQPFVESLAMHPDNNLVVTGGAKGIICLWDFKTKKRLAWVRVPMKDPQTYMRFDRVPGAVVAFSSDGKVLAGGGYQAITFWDVPQLLQYVMNNPDQNPELPKDNAKAPPVPK